MLIRALFISFLTHLAILLSLAHFDLAAWPAISGREANAVSMVLGRRSGRDSLDPDVRTVPMVDAKSRSAVRQSIPRLETKVDRADFGRFSGATVEPAKSRQAENHNSLEVPSSETQPASAEAIGQYRLNVARSARQFKRYPSQARENGWEGVVHVAIAMPIGPGNPTVALDRSSGHAVLDRQALDMVERAVSLAILPEGVRGRNLTIYLPVDYRLSD